MLRISKEEGIEITEDAARVIARVSRGGMRDAISLLELCAGANAKIDESLVFETVGSGNRENSFRMIRAICRSDYETIYSIINDIVMKSGDLSVFWQEIIDAYRDVMIVKNSERAKIYLDLTDSEYLLLSDIAAEFTMARLSYHTSMLEDAMADMQRAVNSKRSIAEITLTRMCDTRLSTTNEALLLRIEELEKAVKMLKLGVTSTPQTSDSIDIKPQKTEVKAEQNAYDAPKTEKKAERPLSIYGQWGAVLKKIAELKRSLSAGFAGASVYTDGSRFVIRMSGFFAEKLKKDNIDLSIVRGVIAEQEGTTPDKITLVIESNDRPSSSGDGDIEDLFK